MNHPLIKPYQHLFEKYDPALDTSIDPSDMSPSMGVFLMEVVSHGNLVLLKDISEKFQHAPDVQRFETSWSMSATMLAALEEKSDVLGYLMKDVVFNYSRSGGCLQLLNALTLKSDLSHFDQIFQSISDKKFSLYPTSGHGTGGFVYNLVGRNERLRLEHVCQMYPSLLENAEILNQSGVYACCYHSTDTLQYLMQYPYDGYNWTLWLVGAADSYSLSANTECANMILDAVPQKEKVHFFNQLMERLERGGKNQYIPFMDVIIPYMLELPTRAQKELLTNLKLQQNTFATTACDALKNQRLKQKISKKITTSPPTRAKKM